MAPQQGPRPPWTPPHPGSPTDLIKGTIKSGLTVEDLIITGINYLDTRSNFWRQQKPIYARERDRKLMQERWLRDRKRRPSQTARYILKSLEDIDMRGWPSQRVGGGSSSAGRAPGSTNLWVGLGGRGAAPAGAPQTDAALATTAPPSLRSADQRQR